MRTAFLLGVTVLLLVLLLEGLAARTPRRAHSVAGADGGLSLLATAKGTLLPRPRLAGGEEDLDVCILVGDAIVVSEDLEPGLRLARVHPERPLSSERLDPVADPAAVGRLEALADDSPPGTVLVLANRGRFSPEEPEGVARLSGVLERLGSRAGAAGLEPVSWALMTLRTTSGWRPLGEAVGRDTGVALAYTLARDWTPPPGAGDLLRARLEGEGSVRLDLELAAAVPPATRVEASEHERVGPVVLPALRFVPGRDADGPRSVVWSAVHLSEAPRLRAAIGLREDSRAGTDGAWFSVLVDGELVQRTAWTPRADGLGNWRPFEADLSPWSGRTVRLELLVEPGDHATGDDALFGLPELVMQGTTP